MSRADFWWQISRKYPQQNRHLDWRPFIKFCAILPQSLCTTSMHRWKQGKAKIWEIQAFNFLWSWIYNTNINGVIVFLNKLLLATLHFNENSTGQQAKNQNGDLIYIVSFLKGRHGEGVAKEVKFKQTFSRCKLTNFITECWNRLVKCYHNYTSYLQITLMNFLKSSYSEEKSIVLLQRPVLPTL